MSAIQTERLIFIDFRLMFLGDISRQDLTDRFGISEPAATRDLAEYRERRPQNLEYDHVLRQYVRTNDFMPVYSHSGEDALVLITEGYSAPSERRKKSIIRAELPVQLDRPDTGVVAAVTYAIHRGKAIAIEYCSHSSGRTNREIVPFAVVDNGLRWHVRAFDRRRGRFSDFVLARIGAPEVIETEIADEERWENDIQWNRVLELELVPHPKRPHPDTCVFEHRMDEGILRLKLRAAVAGYFLRRWNVDCSPDHRLEGNEYQLWLRNWQALYGVETLDIAPGYEFSRL